ncbi:IS21-like element helper ATPase IstB [Aneurinibacillus aneurinilyticus]|uniref:IstB-like ATP-binding protein n=1 Tax=Aneurinibacillus aneurinilyticus ATCC 12856 TaxID=649747 RepID=U1WSQ1_ANEAE|nr:IS21-like element helper ATPase IstB [Aneurinibacillus aneurinilyticus]ERI05695.1 IstB-like ATP-binding protein [Aneurinibacillus aneurinilyticus ATCC 12856]MED0708919.1 IS21-like element helper ATPase IstB [Aneurinibacillus aneurinilyticus]MED0722908.1 IS21-like element helper ATPase IstB [Aneurinibacillus aneurinilyticus]MED0732592.1 IS21-like element helper ATPase IstB [Aneurinibacillus aneurinilyticus]MED0740682.1 IS21-like element helper ATPase IstB [Aneurinibacillus aneurinilyticus]
MSEKLVELCTKLQLPVTANSWSTVADQAAKNNIPYSAFLERLLEAELADKHLRSSQTLLKLSGFPFRKTLDEFQFEAQPTIDERRIRELMNLSFLESHENVLFLGPPGLGKTHLAISIGMEAISRGFKTYFISANDLVTQLRKADEDNRLERKIRTFMKPRILIIDEMGYLRLNTSSAHYLFQVISRRYERGSIILTSNKSFGEWGEILGDSVIATAILDRLLHHSRIFNLKGESYRLRERRLSSSTNA